MNSARGFLLQRASKTSMLWRYVLPLLFVFVSSLIPGTHAGALSDTAIALASQTASTTTTMTITFRTAAAIPANGQIKVSHAQSHRNAESTSRPYAKSSDAILTFVLSSI